MSETSPRSPSVTYTLDGDIAVITIDDGKANAISHEILVDVYKRQGRR